MNRNNILYRNVDKPDIDTIIEYIEIVCDKYNIDFDNLKTESSQRFNFIAKQIGNHFFKNTDVFKMVNSNGNITLNGNNIIEYTDIYILLCDIYNKIPSILGLCDFICLDYDAVTLNPETMEVLKMVNLERERRLMNNLEDGKKNPVGTIAILNKCYAWDKESQSNNDNNRKILSVNDLKDIFAISTTKKE